MFIPRHPVVENQFCQFATTSGTAGIGGVVAYAGAVCYLDQDAAFQDAIVDIYRTVAPVHTEERIPFPNTQHLLLRLEKKQLSPYCQKQHL